MPRQSFAQNAAKFWPLILFAAKTKRISIWERDDLVQEGLLLLDVLVKNGNGDLPDEQFEKVFKTALWNRMNDIVRSELYPTRDTNKTKSGDASRPGFEISNGVAPTLWDMLSDVEVSKNPVWGATFHDLVETVEDRLLTDPDALTLFRGLVHPSEALLRAYEVYEARKAMTGERNRSKLPIPPKIFMEVFGWHRLRFRQALRAVQEVFIVVSGRYELATEMEAVL